MTNVVTYEEEDCVLLQFEVCLMTVTADSCRAEQFILRMIKSLLYFMPVKG